MSWLERVNTQMIIKCGDGKAFTPHWFDAEKSKGFNFSEFEFIDIEGALIDRREPKARRFNFKIIFQGEDNIEQAAIFEESANDRRAWRISHPLYDGIVVHPISLKFDDNKYNATEITGTLIETIARSYPFESTDPIEEIITRSEDSALSNQELAVNEIEIGVDAVEINTALYNETKEQVPTDNAEEYFNLFTEANTKIYQATSGPEAKLQAVIDTQNFILAPARFVNSLKARIRIFESQINALINLIPSTATKNNQLLFEWQGSSIMNGMALSVSNSEDSDFENAVTSLAIAYGINVNFSNYILKVDSFQSSNGATITSYSPSQQNIQSLTGLVNFSTSNILNIALNSKQERILLLYKSSNLIELTHRFYGLDELDKNIEDLIKQNGWGINFYLQVPANTEVKYYV